MVALKASLPQKVELPRFALAGAMGWVLFSMLFMVIERFENNDMLPAYRRMRDEGRTVPEGLTYVDSWVEPNFSRCFQLMECSDLRKFQEWILHWRGCGVEIEIIPVVGSKDTREVVQPWLEKG